MSVVMLKYDLNHKRKRLYLKPKSFPLIVPEITVNRTRLMVLIGIRIAAANGDKVPVTANDSPTKL